MIAAQAVKFTRRDTPTTYEIGIAILWAPGLSDVRLIIDAEGVLVKNSDQYRLMPEFGSFELPEHLA